MSDDYEFSEDPTMMRMEEDGEATSDDPMSAAGDCGLMGGEAEGSKIDASKNEEDEGYGSITQSLVPLVPHVQPASGLQRQTTTCDVNTTTRVWVSRGGMLMVTFTPLLYLSTTLR